MTLFNTKIWKKRRAIFVPACIFKGIISNFLTSYNEHFSNSLTVTLNTLWKILDLFIGRETMLW